MKNLVFFTQSFPYGQGESFIENEIGFLCKAFDEVLILPLKSKGLPTRNIPENCTVFSPVVKDEKDILRKGLFCRAPWGYFLRKFFSEKAFCSFYRLKKYIAASLTCRAILSNPDFKKINRQQKDAVFYFYWGIGSAYILPFVQNTNQRIVRFHGTDLYLERRPEHYLPFRKEVFENLTKAVFISRQGLEYARKTFGKYPFQGDYSYLGTLDHGITPPNSGKEIQLLSCSNLIPLKRVERILASLLLLKDRTIHWTHIGGGEGLDSLRQQLHHLPAHLSVCLTAPLSNKEVIAYYQNHPVDIFINVSSSEGLPVSIMEAISFNIPVIATDVGGSHEIVTPQSGILIPENFNNQQLAEQILHVYQNKQSFQPRKLWEEKFSADKNYTSFIKEILNR